MEDIRAAIEISNASFSEAVRSRDPEQVSSFYADDAVLLVGELPPVRGREQIAAWFGQAFLGGLTDLTFRTTEIRPFADTAIEEGAYSMTTGGSEQAGRYVVVHQPGSDGRWRVLYDVVQPRRAGAG